jgi:hypothetical protein
VIPPDLERIRFYSLIVKLPRHTLAVKTELIQYCKTKIKSNIMKRRVRKIVNFFAFNLLFFALYLNFIHKDKAVADTNVSANSAVVMTGTVPVENPEKYLGQTTQPVSAAQQTTVAEKQEQSSALKLTIN